MSKDIPDSLFFIAIVIILALAASPLFASDRSRYMGPPGMDGADGQDGAAGLNGVNGTDGLNGTNGYNGRDGDDADGNPLGLAASQVDMDWDYNGYQVGAGAAYYDDSEAAVVSVGRKVCWSGCGHQGLLKGSLGVSDGDVGVGVGFTWRP